MKKAIVAALAAGALVLSGCAKTEVTEVSDSRAISFSNFVTSSVKSIDGLDGLEAFYVYGGYEGNWALFNNQKVTKSGTEWVYTPTRYWNANEKYWYAAYSNNNDEVNVTDRVFDPATHHLSFTFQNLDHINADLIYASAGASEGLSWNGTDVPKDVPFTFRHILSQVNFQFTKAADLNGMNLTVSDITVNANLQGKFTGREITEGQYPLDCWSDWGTPTDFDYPEVVLNEDNQTVTVNRVMVPQSIVGYTVTFNVTYAQLNEDGSINNDETRVREFSVDIEGTEGNVWNPGYIYTYKATIAAENLGLTPIVFDVVGVEEWADEDVTLDVPVGTEI